MAKGEETRATLIDAAISLASEDGLAGVTIGRLAEKVGMSKSGLFAHFSSKANLDIAILTSASERFLDHVVSPALKAPRGEPRVAALFERWLTWRDVHLPGGCVFMMASFDLYEKEGEARDALVRSQEDWLETIATAARIAIKEGHFKKGLDVEQFAHDVYSLGVGHFHIRRLLRDAKSETRVRSAFARLLRDARTQN